MSGGDDPKQSSLVLHLSSSTEHLPLSPNSFLLLFYLQSCVRSLPGCVSLDHVWESHTHPHPPTSTHSGRWSGRSISPSCSLRSNLQPPAQVPNSSLIEHRKCAPILGPLAVPSACNALSPQIHGAHSLLPSELCSKFALSESSFPSPSFPYPASLCSLMFYRLLDHRCAWRTCLCTHYLAPSAVSAPGNHTLSLGLLLYLQCPKQCLVCSIYSINFV